MKTAFAPEKAVRRSILSAGYLYPETPEALNTGKLNSADLSTPFRDHSN